MLIQNTSRTRKKVIAWFFLLSLCLFLLSVVLGISLALQLALPQNLVSILDYTKIRPLHTFMAFMAVMSGLQGFVLGLLSPMKRYSHKISIVQFISLFAFIVIGCVAISIGFSTGREYFSWPPILSPLFLSSLILLLIQMIINHKEFETITPEGLWLIGFGLLFLVAGLLESHLWLLENTGLNLIRELTVQWHGIDTYVAGQNAVLYGCGVYLVQQKATKLRKIHLYLIASFSLLFTFGHHHYISPQPHFLKVLAFLASMVAVFSFLRHFKARSGLKKEIQQNILHIAPLLNAVELWTLVSIASGVLFAIPQINLYIHGTFLIVIHAMGSMIGVNFLLILAGALYFYGLSVFPQLNLYQANEHESKYDEQVKGIIMNTGDNPSTLIQVGTKILNMGLTLFWIVAFVIASIKGIGRVEYSYQDYQPLRQYVFYVLPLIGSVLATGICLLCYVSIRFIHKNTTIGQSKP